MFTLSWLTTKIWKREGGGVGGRSCTPGLLVEIGEALEREKKRVSDLEEENEALREAVEKMLLGEELRVNKTLHESGERSARYQLKTLRSRLVREYA